jgi:adenylate cyclase
MGIYTHVLHQFHDDAQLTLEWCERTLAYATGHALPYWAALASIVKARIEAGQGDAVGGVARIRASLERYRATGAKLGFTWFMLMLAEAQLAAGAIAESMQVVREALALGQETGERYYEAELHRLTGELALAGAARDAGRAAEAAFLLSIEVARAQGALVWELRGTCSLARLWSGSQRREEAHRTLQEILARFGQGFASADVRAARVLLAELVPPA